MAVGDTARFPPGDAQWEVVLEFACKDNIGATRLVVDTWRNHVDPDHSLPDEDIRIDVLGLSPSGSGVANLASNALAPGDTWRVTSSPQRAPSCC